MVTHFGLNESIFETLIQHAPYAAPPMKAPTIAELIELAPGQVPGEDRLYLAADGTARVSFNGVDYHSAYQAIFDASLGGVTQSLSASPSESARFGDEIGFQGMLQRVGTPDAPIDLLSPIEDDLQLVAMDRLSRMLHAINFFGTGRASLLFLNVHEKLLKSIKYDHGRHFSEVLLNLRLNPSRIVIELPETAVAHRTFVGYLIKSYQSYGFKVAGNLHNAGQILSIPDMNRLDFIKINAADALRDGMVKPLVNYAARLKIPLIFKQVNDLGQFTMLQQFDVRFVQGGLFSAPAGTAPKS
jgi:EAL domain-containing protein (putative c-di-GMP-specific phosphodiesterase class I)